MKTISLVQYLRCSSPNNEVTSKWLLFCINFMAIFCSAVEVYPPNSGYPSAEAPYFVFELRVLVAAATRIEIATVPKVGLYSILWGS